MKWLVQSLTPNLCLFSWVANRKAALIRFIYLILNEITYGALISFEEREPQNIQRRGIITRLSCLFILVSLFFWILNYDISIASDPFYFSVNSVGPKLSFKHWVPLPFTHPHLFFSSLFKLTVSVNIFRG